MGIQTCESCFTKLQCLGHFKVVDMSEHYNHTTLNVVWSRLSPTRLPLLFRVINLIGKHSLQYRGPSMFVKTTPYVLWRVVFSESLIYEINQNYLCSVSMNTSSKTSTKRAKLVLLSLVVVEKEFSR